MLNVYIGFARRRTFVSRLFTHYTHTHIHMNIYLYTTIKKQTTSAFTYSSPFIFILCVCGYILCCTFMDVFKLENNLLRPLQNEGDDDSYFHCRYIFFFVRYSTTTTGGVEIDLGLLTIWIAWANHGIASFSEFSLHAYKWRRFTVLFFSWEREREHCSCRRTFLRVVIALTCIYKRAQ